MQRLKRAQASTSRLRVLERYTIEDGMLVALPTVAPSGAAVRGYRWVGGELEVGLNQREVDGLRARMAAVLAEVGKVAVF